MARCANAARSPLRVLGIPGIASVPLATRTGGALAAIFEAQRRAPRASQLSDWATITVPGDGLNSSTALRIAIVRATVSASAMLLTGQVMPADIRIVRPSHFAHAAQPERLPRSEASENIVMILSAIIHFVQALRTIYKFAFF